MTNFVADFLKQSVTAVLCCGLMTGYSVPTALAQDTDGAGTAGGAAAAGQGNSPDMGSAKNAAEYEVLQKRALQQINLNDGFLTPKVLQQYKKYERQYRDALRSGPNPRNPEDEVALRAGLDYRTLVLSDPAVQNDPVLFQGYTTNLQRDVTGAAPQAMVSSATNRSKIRRLVCSIVFEHLKKMINEGNFRARSAALGQLLNLEVVPGRNRQRIEMYDQADKLLVSVMNDPKQPDAVKLRAANVMKKYLQKADAAPAVEMAFAAAIAKEVKRKWLAVPYYNSLLSALEWVRAPRQVVGSRDPIVFCAMVELMQNKEVDLYVRCRATRVLGRAGYDRSINFEPLAWGTADLTKEVAVQYFQSNSPKDPKWARCGWFLYTAFHHEDGKETDGQGPFMPKGFLNRSAESEMIRKGYEATVPVMAHLMSGDNPKQIGRLTNPVLEWLKNSKPTNMKCDPACPAIGGGQ